MNNLFKYIVGFRSSDPTKMTTASIYYLFSILMILNSVPICLMLLSIPFMIFNAIKLSNLLIDETQTIEIYILIISCITFFASLFTYFII